MSYPVFVTAQQEQVVPVVTVSLSKPDVFLRDYISDLGLTFDSPTERVLEGIPDIDYKSRAEGLIPHSEGEQRRFMSPRYEKFAPVSGASRLGSSEGAALIVDRIIDRARGV